MIIGITGYLKSGKTTVANYLEAFYGYTVRRFAEGLNEDCAYMLAAADGDDDFEAAYQRYMREMADPDTKDKYRDFQIWYGTTYRRGQDPDYWIKRGWRTPLQKRTAIDNVRMPNEVNELKRLGGILIRVDRHVPSNIESLPETERHIPTYFPGFVLHNWEEGNLQFLFSQVDEMMAALCHRCGSRKSACQCGKEK